VDFGNPHNETEPEGFYAVGFYPLANIKLGDRSRDVPYLLGGWGSRKDVRTGQVLDGPKEKWKPDMEVVKATIRFLEKTGRLTYQPEAE
jgi:hypothetical protein